MAGVWAKVGATEAPLEAESKCEVTERKPPVTNLGAPALERAPELPSAGPRPDILACPLTLPPAAEIRRPVAAWDSACKSWERWRWDLIAGQEV